MSLTGIRSLKSAVRGIGPMVGGVGAIGGFISDVIKPVFALAPFLFFLCIMIALIIYVIPFRRKIKAIGLQEAFASRLGGGFLVACGFIVAFGILSILYLQSPPEGFAANEFEAIRQIQKSVLGIEQDLSKIQQDVKTTVTRLKNVRERIQALAKQGGLISQPSSDADYYHNAKIHELNGHMEMARQSYEKFIEMQPSFVDVHESYQSIINNTEGKNATAGVYQKLKEKFSTHPTILMMQAKTLPTRVEQLSELKKLIAQFPDYPPIYFEFVSVMVEPGYGALSKEETASYAKALARWQYLLDQGKYQPFFIDLRIIDRKREKAQEAQTMWNNFGNLYQPESVAGELAAIQKGGIPKL